MSNEFDTMYINNLVDRDYPPMPMLAAADTGRLPEVVVTGEAEPPGPGGPAGKPEPRFGRGGVTKARSEAAGGLEVPAMGLADMLAGALRGTVAQSLGLPGDLESLVRLLTGGEQVLPTTEDISEKGVRIPFTDTKVTLPPVVPPNAPDIIGYSAAERRKTADVAGKLGEFNPIVGAPEAVKIGVKGAKAVGEALAPAAGKMAEEYLRKTGGLVNAVPVEDYIFVAADTAARVDGGAVKLSNKVSEGKKLQLDPKYRVSVEGAYEPQGGGQNIINDVNPGNIQDISFRLDNLAETFPDPLESPEKFSSMLATVYNSTEVPMPPRWLIQNVNDMDKWSKWFSTMSKNQIDEADRGFAVVEKFRDIYRGNIAKADTTGRLMMWSMMSRMASAYPHESGFLDLAEAMGPIINKAVRGEYTEADVAEGLRIVQQSIPKGSPGRQVISNANAFVDTFLVRMSEKIPDGRTKLQALHDMIIDPNMTGPQIRRAFYGLAEGVGIKNKVLSFALLVSGREDVMVLDRIQINRLFAGGDKIYDDVAGIFDGGPGLAIYEGLERSLAKKIQELYRRVGREDKASVGRYHWESWVLSSGQEVAHPTLETIVKSAKGEADAFVGVPVMEGRTHQTVYGVTYERTPGGGNRFVFATSKGDKYQFNKNELDAMFNEVMEGKNKAVPKDFPGVKYFSKDTLPDGSPNPYFGKPWYTWPGVDRERIDQAAKTYGTPINAKGGSGDMGRAVKGNAPDGSKRTAANERNKPGVTRGRTAPKTGAE